MRLILVYASAVLFYGASCLLAQSQEDSLRLAWAVRRLVANTCNSSSTAISAPCVHCQGRSGKIGPIGPPGALGAPGPRGPPGACTCRQDEVETLKAEMQRLENKLIAMEYMLPEAFCLLGLKTGSIPDSAITVSTMHSAAYCQITNSRLDHHGAWCATANRIGSDWIQVDLGKKQRVTGVVTQGQGRYPATNEWVTSFKVEYGSVAGSRTAITENNNAKTFSPVNFNKNTKVVTRFPEPIYARYIRIVPLSYSGHMSMRFDVINC